MAIYGGPDIVTDGLVLCLDAGNNKSYPGSGSTIYDLSTYNSSGTMSSITFNTSNQGNLLFDFASDYIVINHSSIFNFDSTFTVSIWLKINTLNLTTIYNIISKKPNFNSTQKGWSCQLDYRTTGILQYRNNNGTVSLDNTPTSTANNTSLLNQTSFYKNLVWVIKKFPATVTFYIDGIQKSGPHSVLYTDIDTNNNLYIGKTLGSTGDSSPPMSVSQVSLYNRDLLSIEIINNYNALKGRFGL